MENNSSKLKSLFKLRLFWLVVIISISAAFYVATTIFNHDNHEFITTSYGAVTANKFILMYQLPLGILAFGFSILLLIATNHRSSLSVEQIAISNNIYNQNLTQNTLKNYYESVLYFERYIDSNVYLDKINIKNKRRLYRLFFPKNTYEKVDLKISLNDFENINYKLITCCDEYIYKQLEGFELDKNIITENSNFKQLERDQKSIKVVELIINDFIIKFDSLYGIQLKKDAFIEGVSVIEAFVDITDEIQQLFYHCLDFLPDAKYILNSNLSFTNQDAWKKLEEIINNESSSRFNRGLIVKEFCNNKLILRDVIQTY